MSAPGPDKIPTPLTDEQIRQITIGELKPHNAPILLAEYDPTWPEHFARQARRIQVALGQRALRIEHIGSTAIPGSSPSRSSTSSSWSPTPQMNRPMSRLSKRLDTC